MNLFVLNFCVYNAQTLARPVTILCSGLSFFVLIFCVYNVKMLVSSEIIKCSGLSFLSSGDKQSFIQCHFLVYALMCDECCAKTKENFREYRPILGGHRSRGSRLWRTTEVVYLCTLTMQ
jgi:hypothetical protein